MEDFAFRDLTRIKQEQTKPDEKKTTLVGENVGMSTSSQRYVNFCILNKTLPAWSWIWLWQLQVAKKKEKKKKELRREIIYKAGLCKVRNLTTWLAKCW